MLKSSMMAATIAVCSTVAFLAVRGTSKPEAEAVSVGLADARYWDAYSVSDYYGGEYDWPGLKLADPATRQSIIHAIVPQIENLAPDHLARLAKQEDFCSGPYSIKCFGIPTSKLRGYVEWSLGRHSHKMAARFAEAAQRLAASEEQAR